MKKKNVIIVILVGLSFLLVGLGSYFVFQTFTTREVPVTKNKEENFKKPVERELSVAEQQTLLSQIKLYNSLLGSLYPIDNIKKVDNQTILQFAFKQVEIRNAQFMESDLQKILDQYFGTSLSVSYEDIMCFADDGVLYQYNSSTRKYQFTGTHGHGGSGVLDNSTYLLSGKVQDDIYTVKVASLYGNYCSDVCGPTDSYYQSAQGALQGKTPIYTLKEEEIGVIEADEVYKKVADQLPVTIFTFQKDKDGNYGLQKVSSE